MLELAAHLSGDGHGVDGMGSWYEVTIVECEERPELVGMSHEWAD